MSSLTYLDVEQNFPPVSYALKEPDGLLAIGGDLSPKRLLNAYSQGIFPWFSEDDIDILWWSPDPRAIYPLDNIKIHRSMRKVIRQSQLTITLNQDFDNVINQCAEVKANRPSTWITYDMQFAYSELHRQGKAHSIEVWQDDSLVGGLYGVSVGSCFCGESMFSNVSNASKIAFYFLATWLQRHKYRILDCQLPNDHLMHLGAQTISRQEYIRQLKQAVVIDPKIDWQWPQRFSASDILEALDDH